MLHLHLGIHLESLALGMALSFTIFLVIFAIRWEIQMYKKRKLYNVSLRGGESNPSVPLKKTSC